MDGSTSSVITINAFALSLLLSVSWVVGLAFYRLVLSPLSGVPGPKLAALTKWYEYYYDCVKQGKYVFKIEELHKEYGPVVRINPNEIHIKDPEYFGNLYNHTSKLDKDPWYYGMFGPAGGTFGTSDHALHRARRGVLGKFFSPASINLLEPRLHFWLEKLLGHLEEHRKAGSVIDFSSAYHALTMDIITEYILPNSTNFLEKPGFGGPLHGALKLAQSWGNLNRHFPLISPVLRGLPRSISERLDSTGGIGRGLDHLDRIEQETRAVIRSADEKASLASTNDTSPNSVIELVYTTPDLPASDRTYERIFDEVLMITGAGSENACTVLTRLTYQLLSNPSMLSRLLAELAPAAASLPKGTTLLPYRILEKLPYLEALVKESLRYSPAVVGRLPRINRHAAMTYVASTGKTYTFPPGTVLSMNIRDLQSDPSIFPSPNVFDPDRWLDSSSSDNNNLSRTHRQRMDRFLVPFSRGSRMCVGMELAKQELVLTIGNIFARFGDGMTLFETQERDIAFEHDFFAPFARADSLGLRGVFR